MAVYRGDKIEICGRVGQVAKAYYDENGEVVLMSIDGEIERFHLWEEGVSASIKVIERSQMQKWIDSFEELKPGDYVQWKSAKKSTPNSFGRVVSIAENEYKGWKVQWFWTMGHKGNKTDSHPRHKLEKLSGASEVPTRSRDEQCIREMEVETVQCKPVKVNGQCSNQ